MPGVSVIIWGCWVFYCWWLSGGCLWAEDKIPRRALRTLARNDIFVELWGKRTEVAMGRPVNGERKARRRRMPKDGDDGKAVRKKADGEAGKQRKVTIDDVFADDELEEKKKDRGMIFLSAFLAFLIMGLIAFLIFMLRSDLERVVLGMPEFEESVVRDGEPAEDGERVDLAVVPDFVVTKEDSSFPIPYPEGNVFDVEFAFVNEKGKEVYHTKRIKPGTIVSIPAYEFCKMGKETYEIRVEVYDGDTFKPVQSAVALEMKITKE